MNIIPDKWLILVTGKDEKELIEDITDNRPILLKYPKLRFGEFNTYSIHDLLTMVKGLTSTPAENNLPNDESKPANKPVFHIYMRKPLTDVSDNQYFDTSALQLNLQSSKPVMFQVASNFNCHENSSVVTNLVSGHYLTGLMSDSTQGPAASAGVGAIERLRCHIAKPINLLENTGFKVKNGKLVKTSPNLGKENIEHVKIGLQIGLSANFDRSYSKFQSCIFYQDGTIIDQVFVSSIALDKHTNSRPHSQQNLDAARFLLKAAYDGTYLCTIKQKTERLVLTMVGGGVFNNPLEDIMDAIACAHANTCNLHWSTECHLKEVILPLFDRKIDPKHLIDKLTNMGFPTVVTMY